MFRRKSAYNLYRFVFTPIIFNLVFFVLQPLLPVKAFSGPGDGSPSDPFQIANCVQLQEMNDDLDAHYELVNDIDCSDTINWNSGEGFDTIGPTFTGQLDGQNFTVTDLNINRPLESDVGLFAQVSGFVTRLRLLTPIIRGDLNVGGIAGNTSFGADINQIMVVEADILGVQEVGGIVGLCTLCNIGDTMSSGSIDGDTRVGGIVGRLNSAALTTSYSWASVTGDDNFVGGLAGFMDNSSISSSYSSGPVGSSNPAFVGGITGGFNGGTITSVFAVGPISGGLADLVGAIVGDLDAGDVIEAYWDSNTTGQSDCAAVFSSNTCTGTAVTDPVYFNVDQGNPPVDSFLSGGSFMGPYRLPKLTSLHHVITATIDPDLIGYWKLDDPVEGSGLLDSSGRGNYGTPQGDVLGPVPEFVGKPDTGFNNPASHNFNGIDHYYDLIPNIDIRSSDFTVAFWANRSNNFNDDYVFTIEGGGDNNNLVVGFRGGNNFTCAFWNNDLDYSNYANELNNSWNHWACTYNVSTNVRKIYLNGSLVAEDTASEDFLGIGPTSIGQLANGAFYEGLLDDIRVYDEEVPIEVVRVIANVNEVPVVSNLGPSNLVNGSWGTDSTPSFSFDISDANGDNVQYQIQIDNDSNFASPTVDYTSVLDLEGSRAFTVGQAAGGGTYNVGSAAQTLPSGSYYWRVTAIDENADPSLTVTANSGSIAFRIDITPPSVPVGFVGPGATNDTTPLTNWSPSSDNVGLGTPAYRVQLDNNSDFSSIDGTFTTSNSNYTFSTPLTAGTWYVRVRSEDHVGNVSAYTSGIAIVIDLTNPSAPGKPATSTPTAITKPTWSWTASTDTSGILLYQVQWSQTIDFGSGVFASTASTATFTHSTALSPGTWYFRVRGQDYAGNISDYSQIGNVVTSSAGSSGGGSYTPPQSTVTDVTNTGNPILPPPPSSITDNTPSTPPTYTVTLTVNVDNVPMVGVLVTLNGNEGTTNSRGEVTFTNVPAGSYEVIMSKDGKTTQLTVAISGSRDTLGIKLNAVFDPGINWLLVCPCLVILVLGGVIILILVRRNKKKDKF